MQETPVRFLGREDPLEKGEATHSSIVQGLNLGPYSGNTESESLAHQEVLVLLVLNSLTHLLIRPFLILWYDLLLTYFLILSLAFSIRSFIKSPLLLNVY